MRSQILRHSSLCLGDSSKSVYSSPRSPILRSTSKSPLKNRKSVHFADSVFEQIEHFHQQHTSPRISPDKPSSSNEIRLFRNTEKHQKISQPPPEDYNQRSIEISSRTYSNEGLMKSLEMRKQANYGKAKKNNLQVRSNNRHSSVSRAPKSDTQKEFIPKRMNFAFRDSAFYQKLNTFYTGQTTSRHETRQTRRRK